MIIVPMRSRFIDPKLADLVTDYLKSLYLQNINGEECTMSGTRTLFDALIKKYPLPKDDITTN